MIKHKHHIIPRHVGGTNEPSNIIELTIDEHADAHKILYETHGRWQDYIAWQSLSVRMLIEEIRIQRVKLANTGRKQTKEHLDKRIKALTGRKCSDTHIKNMSESSSKEYEFFDPTGNKVFIRNITEYCKNNNLNAGHMVQVFKGKCKHHKGWTKSI